MAFWIALSVLVAGVVGGLAYVVFRGLSLWRQLKRTGGSFATESARIADTTARIQGHLDRANDSGERLRDGSARLALSRARLDVQLQAIREARHTMKRLLWFLPGT